MKKYFQKCGFRVLLALALCAGVSSCSKDDDDDKKTENTNNGENGGNGSNGVNGGNGSNGENGGNGNNGGDAVDTDSYAPTAVVNGHGYVDLGLPSGTLWATMNVGAESIELGGDFVMWSSVNPGENKTWDTYYCKTYWMSNAEMVKEGRIDENWNLTPAYDYATYSWGDEWRTPTAEEIKELTESCTFTLEEVNGQKGYKAKGPNGKCIFLPLGGWCPTSWNSGTGTMGAYWSATSVTHLVSSLGDDDYIIYAQIMRMEREYAPKLTDDVRESGCNIRPVRKK